MQKSRALVLIDHTITSSQPEKVAEMLSTVVVNEYSNGGLGVSEDELNQGESVAAPLVNYAVVGKDDAVLAIPREAYDVIMETLSMDAHSTAYDPALRKQIQEAIESIQELA